MHAKIVGAKQYLMKFLCCLLFGHPMTAILVWSAAWSILNILKRFWSAIIEKLSAKLLVEILDSQACLDDVFVVLHIFLLLVVALLHLQRWIKINDVPVQLLLKMLYVTANNVIATDTFGCDWCYCASLLLVWTDSVCASLRDVFSYTVIWYHKGTFIVGTYTCTKIFLQKIRNLFWPLIL